MRRPTQHARNAGSPRCPTGCAPTATTTRDARLSRPSSPAPGIEALGVPPEGGRLFELALTHRSFAFEQPEQPEVPEHNERLEFLGDAILGAVVTDLIYRRYPELPEGDMARLRASVVNTEALADLARSLEIGPHVRLGKGEAASGGRSKPSILANTVEALIGAVYIERGVEAVTEALTPLLGAAVEESIAAGGYSAKNELQEVAVRAAGAAPSYRVAASGPDHDKRFTARVYVDGEAYGVGHGRSKKEAEKNAARAALERIESEEPTDQGGRDARAS